MHNNIQGWNMLNFYLWVIYYMLVAVILYLLIQDNIELSKHQNLPFHCPCALSLSHYYSRIIFI